MDRSIAIRTMDIYSLGPSSVVKEILLRFPNEGVP